MLGGASLCIISGAVHEDLFDERRDAMEARSVAVHEVRELLANHRLHALGQSRRAEDKLCRDFACAGLVGRVLAMLSEDVISDFR